MKCSQCDREFKLHEASDDVAEERVQYFPQDVNDLRWLENENDWDNSPVPRSSTRFFWYSCPHCGKSIPNIVL